MSTTETRIPIGTSFPSGYPNYGYTFQVVKSGPKQCTCELVRPDGTLTGQRSNWRVADVRRWMTPEHAELLAREAVRDQQMRERIAADVRAGVLAGLLDQPAAKVDHDARTAHARHAAQIAEAVAVANAGRHQDTLSGLEWDMDAADEATAERWRGELDAAGVPNADGTPTVLGQARGPVAAGCYTLRQLNRAVVVAHVGRSGWVSRKEWAPFAPDFDPYNNVGRYCQLRSDQLSDGARCWHVERFLRRERRGERPVSVYLVSSAQPVTALAEYGFGDPGVVVLGWTVDTREVVSDEMWNLY